MFIQALQREPSNRDVLYALTILYMQSRQIEKAIETGSVLNQYHGGDPQFAELFKQLRM